MLLNSFWHELARASHGIHLKMQPGRVPTIPILFSISRLLLQDDALLLAISLFIVTSAARCILQLLPGQSESVWSLYSFIHYIYVPFTVIYRCQFYFYRGHAVWVDRSIAAKAALLKLSLSWRNQSLSRGTCCISLRTTSVNGRKFAVVQQCIKYFHNYTWVSIIKYHLKKSIKWVINNYINYYTRKERFYWNI